MLSDLIAIDTILPLFYPRKQHWDCYWRISTNRRTLGRLGTRVRRRSYITVLHSFSPTNPPIPIVNPGDYYPSISFYWSLRSNRKKLPELYRFFWTKLVEYKIRAHSSPVPFQETKNQNLCLSGLLKTGWRKTNLVHLFLSKPPPVTNHQMTLWMMKARLLLLHLSPHHLDLSWFPLDLAH